MTNKITIYTDGAVINNGSKYSKCGWAYKLMYRGQSKFKSGNMRGKTNNYMEMLAVLNALKIITDKSIPVEIYSDSQYVTKTINGEYRIGANADLWKELMNAYKEFKDIKIIWVRGHSGNAHNEQVDKLAYGEAQNA